MITKYQERYAKKFCRDDISKIPGYEDAISSEDRYEIHHILELTLNGEHSHTWKELDSLGMYYDRPYFELIWMKMHEHRSMHKISNNPNSDGHLGRLNKGKRKGIPKSEEWKAIMRIKMIGKNKGKHYELVNGKRRYY